ncbi:MAG TPA: helix-turn-helix domain-containing protein [Longimicrobiales bacterium]|nr:helix-turn-helix domain-containing protein [Longimicrobiales bacterium]
MSAELATLAADPERVAQVPPEAIPGLIGEAEALKAALWARLQASSAPQAPTPTSNGNGKADHLLTAQQAAERLGVSKRWVYRKAESLPFTRRLSGGTLRFSERGLERWKELRA